MTVTGYSGGVLSVGDLLVYATQREDKSIVRQINVVEVSNTVGNMTIKVKFGGSESGVYDITVRSLSYGRFDSTGVTLTLVGRVTSISPNRGSIYGGTLITINGYQFSYEKTDNPVRVGYSDCLVEYTSPTQIQCRTTASLNNKDKTEDLVVFLKTYEEAKCDGTICSFTWVQSTLPNITNQTVAYDSSVGDYVLTMTGANLGASLTNTRV